MSTGFSTGAQFGSIDAIPDKGFTRNVRARTHVTTFGNGYEQRITQGINPLHNTFNATFSNRTASEMEYIRDYLDSVKGVTAISFTTVEQEVLKVVCEQYTISYNFDGYYTLNATFRQVFES